MTPSKVLHIIGTLDRGGAETVALDICQAIPRSIAEQTFLTLGGQEGRLASDFRAAGAIVDQCPLVPLVTFAPRLWWRLRQLRPDVVVSHVDLSSGVMLAIAWLAGIRGRVARFHSEGDGRASTRRRQLQRFLMRAGLRLFATDVVGVTRAALVNAWGTGRPVADRRYRVVHNGVNMDRLPEIDRTSARRALGLPPDAIVFVHIGRASPEKNRQFLVGVYRAAKARRRNTRLLVVGRGGTNDLQELADDAGVLFAGERDDVGVVLAASDVLLLPSTREGLPSVVLEALACGVPVVAANLPGLREVRHELRGLSLLDLSVGARTWAEQALEKAAAGIGRRQKIRRRFRSSSFLREHIAAAWLDLFRPRAPVARAAWPLWPTVVLGIFLAIPGLTGRTFATEAAVLFVTWAASLVMLARRSPHGLYSASVAYLVLLGLFHGGLLFSVALRGESSLNVLQKIWLNAGYTADAARLSIVGLLAFSIAAAFVIQARRGRPTPTARSTARFGFVGLLAQLLGLAMVVMVVRHAGGFAALTGGYVAFLHKVDGYQLGYAIQFLSIGAVLGIAARGRWRVAAWLLFLLVALVGIPLGTRSIVMFPLAAMIVLEARQGRRMPPMVAGGLVVGLLILSAVVFASRQRGMGALFGSKFAVSPLNTVAEMGSSLRPATVVLSWHAHGEPYRYGATLIAVPLRVIEKWTGWHGGPPVYDTRLLQDEIFKRVGPIGVSPIAEGYHNFGTLGVVGLLGLFGAIVGLLDARQSTPLTDALTGVVLIPLLTGVRNGAAVVLPQIVIGVAAVAIAAIADRAAAPDTPLRSRPRASAVESP